MLPVVEYRRALHRIPELDDRLAKTCAYVRSVLEPLGCRITAPISGGLCAFFDAGKPETAAFRALDARVKGCPGDGYGTLTTHKTRPALVKRPRRAAKEDAPCRSESDYTT